MCVCVCVCVCNYVQFSFGNNLSKHIGSPLSFNWLYLMLVLAHALGSVVKSVKVARLCLTHCDPKDYTVHGILQARVLEWVAVPFSRVSSQPRDRTQVSHFAGGFFISWTTREARLIMQEMQVWSLVWGDPLEEGGCGNCSQFSCLENPHGQRSLADYNPWGCKKSGTAEQLSTAHILTMAWQACYLFKVHLDS